MEFKQLKPTHACSCLWDIDQKPTEIFGHYLKPHEFIHGTNNLCVGVHVCVHMCAGADACEGRKLCISILFSITFLPYPWDRVS